MNVAKLRSSKFSILDVAIYVGLVSIFMAVAVPLLRGAALQKRTAECASKLMWAADAFDQYAANAGEYPPDGDGPGAVQPCREMGRTFYEFSIDWWGESTDLGGAWDWFRDENRGFIAISNPQVSEKEMKRLDRLIDDGNLDGGMFRRYGSIYCYILKQRGRV